MAVVLEDPSVSGLTINDNKLGFVYEVSEQNHVGVFASTEWNVELTESPQASNIKYYEITVNKVDDAVAVGLATKEFPLEGKMPGWEDNSYGYHSDDGKRFYGGFSSTFGPTWSAGQTAGLGLKVSTGEVFATLDGKYIGLIATNLPAGTYKPVIGTNSTCSVTANFDGPFLFDVGTLPTSLVPALRSIDLTVIQKAPSVIIFVDGVNEEEATTLKKAVEVVSLEYKAAREKLEFFFGSDGAETAKLRNFLGLKQSPALVILDLTNKGKYLKEGSITPESVKEFVVAYKAGTLKPLKKSESRPADDKDPSHPNLTKIVATSFNEVVLQNDKDVLVDVYADWCGPCVALAPTYALLGDIFVNTNIVIAKYDTQNNDIDRKYFPENSIPNIKLFPGNNKENPIKFEGERSLAGFLRFLNENAVTKFDLEESITKGKQLQVEAEKKQLKNVKKVETIQEYTEYLKSDKLVVVDFYATWCPPCKAIAPIFADYSEKYSNALFLKVNVDELPEVSQKAGITCMPTFQLYKNGEKIETLEGADRKALAALIEKHL